MLEIVWCAINPDLSNVIQLDSNSKAHMSTIIQSNHWAKIYQPKIFLNLSEWIIDKIDKLF